MSELKVDEKRVVGRNVAIALGMICIVLAACLTGTVVLLNLQITNLQSQVNDLTNIVGMKKYAIWHSNQTISQPANSYNTWTEQADYAGLVTVQVLSSTTNKTYVEVIYSNYNYGINYDQRITLGSSGVATFPIEPLSVIIRVGNSDLTNGANETVTITYYY